MDSVLDFCTQPGAIKDVILLVVTELKQDLNTENYLV